jgi:hypothetical protein
MHVLMADHLSRKPFTSLDTNAVSNVSVISFRSLVHALVHQSEVRELCLGGGKLVLKASDTCIALRQRNLVI